MTAPFCEIKCLSGVSIGCGRAGGGVNEVLKIKNEAGFFVRMMTRVEG